MNQTQAQSLGKELALNQQTIQTAILRRFMTESEMRALEKSYRENSLRVIGKNRFVTLQMEVTPQEEKLLFKWITDENVTGTDLAQEFGLIGNSGKIAHKARTIAIRYLYQNREKLGL